MSNKGWLLLLLAGLALAATHDGGALATPAAGPARVHAGVLATLTYNVAGLPDGISASRPGTNSRQISPLLNAFDVVCLQEDFCFHDEIVAAVDHPYRSVPQRVATTLANDGLTLLSRFPLSRFQRVRWPLANGLVGDYHDCWAAKGFCVATATLAPGVQVDVYDLHGDAGESAGDRRARAAGHALLAAFLARHSADRAVIVAGDFNLDLAEPHDHAAFIDLLERTGLHDVGLWLGDARPCFDRVLFRSGRGVELTPVSLAAQPEFTTVDGQPLSDHPAMACRWVWRQRDGAVAASRIDRLAVARRRDHAAAGRGPGRWQEAQAREGQP